jgi:hypothetical protein
MTISKLAGAALLSFCSFGWAAAYPLFPTGSDMAGVRGVHTVIDASGPRLSGSCHGPV